MYKKPYNPSFKKFTPNKSRGNFKVRGPIKSFRDLDVYNKSTALSAEIFILEISQDFGLSKLDNEIELLKDISKYVPKMIAESYGNRFDNFSIAERKLEKTAQVITSIISKIDFIISIIKKTREKNEGSVSKNDSEVTPMGGQKVQKKTKESKEAEILLEKEEIQELEKRMNDLLKDYSILRNKVLNLKRAWVKINLNFNKK
ncbi:MAG: hypothetical protein V1851_00605 [Patescibacteria group bacterium]